MATPSLKRQRATMSGRRFTDFFNRPSFQAVNKGGTPEKKGDRETSVTSSPASPLTEPPSSFLVELGSDTDISKKDSKENTHLQSKTFPTPQVVIPPQSESAVVPSSSRSESLPSSQRIIKDGKEVVINSDGDESDDSNSSFEDPSLFFTFKSGSGGKRIDTKPSVTRLPAKKYKNTMDSLVIEAVDDTEEEEKVAKAKAALLTPQRDEKENRPKKSILASALAMERDDDGPNVKRILDAVRRTEALDQSKMWRFLDHVHLPRESPGFPAGAIPPGSPLAALQNPESRAHILSAGILEYAAKLQRLPDDVLVWLFHSVSTEPREDSRLAFTRIFSQTSRDRVSKLIRPADVDMLFRNLGAKPEALDPSHPIIETSEYSSHHTSPKTKEVLLSILAMLEKSAKLFSIDTRAHATHILMRAAIDSSLNSDVMIRTELQKCLGALLENVPPPDMAEMDRLVCRPVFDTVHQAEFLGCMLECILPTTSYISLLRYRLAVAFLLQTPGPLTEAPVVVVDLNRLTTFLVRDVRFHAKTHQSNDTYDYGELAAIASLLEVAVNTSLYDLTSQQPDAADEFNSAVDKFAAQIKFIFSFIKDTGASHLQRMVAKEALEYLYYRTVYSVRSKPVPRKTYFEDHGKPRDRNIKDMFQKRNELVFRSPSKLKA